MHFSLAVHCTSSLRRKREQATTHKFLGATQCGLFVALWPQIHLACSEKARTAAEYQLMMP